MAKYPRRGMLMVTTPIEPVSGLAPKAAAAFLQLAVINAQTATHRPGVFRIHIGINEVGKIRNAIF